MTILHNLVLYFRISYFSEVVLDLWPLGQEFPDTAHFSCAVGASQVFGVFWGSCCFTICCRGFSSIGHFLQVGCFVPLPHHREGFPSIGHFLECGAFLLQCWVRLRQLKLLSQSPCPCATLQHPQLVCSLCLASQEPSSTSIHPRVP